MDEECEVKKLECQDFKFDVPLNSAIPFKIMLQPGVLPEVFPQKRERRMRKPMPQGTESSLFEILMSPILRDLLYLIRSNR